MINRQLLAVDCILLMMPELPEVETVRVGLSKFVVGKVITDVKYDWDKSFPNVNADVRAFLIGSIITSIRRRAKVLLIDLSTEYTLVIHLKMTGQLVFVGRQKPQARSTNIEIRNKLKTKIQKDLVIRNSDLEFAKSDEIRFGAGHPNDSLIGKLPDKSTRVTMLFSDGSRLYFNDQRKFGWVKLYPTIEVPNIDFFRKLGPEPLATNFTKIVLRERLMRRPNTNIKAALLDQTVIAGVGNIYADESLWGAKIHPTTLVKNLSKAKTDVLFTELQFVLNLAIEKGGSTDRNYVNAEGKRGSYMDFARVFRRENLPCPCCGTTIIKTRVASRGTHTCPKCQKVISF